MLQQLSERELHGSEECLPVRRRPVRSGLHVATHASTAGHGERHSRAMRRGDGDTVAINPRLSVATMRYRWRAAEHSLNGHPRLSPPAVTAVRAGNRVGFDDASGLASGELRDLPLEERAEQGGSPRPAAIGLAHGLEPQSLPALKDLSVAGPDVQVVCVGVADASPFDGVQDQLAGELGRGCRVDPLDASGQQRRVGDAALDGVHKRVAGTGVAKDQVPG